MTTNPQGNASPPTDPATTETPGKAFGWTYWMLNSIEAFERLAYFGIRSVVPIYIMQATEPGGLHLTSVHKGVIYMWWAFFQSWLPMFTGGFADRYGYKRTLGFAVSANVVGYLIMAYFPSYAGFFVGIIVLATGTAFFKPALQGSIAQNLNKGNASMGWGIFYWVVNVGAVCAPLLATLILGKPHSAEGWRNLFLASAGYTACNLLLLFTFKDVPSGADKTRSVFEVFWETIENICFFWFKGGRINIARMVTGIVALIAGVVVLMIGEIPGMAAIQTPLGIALCVVGALLPLWLDGGTFTWQVRLPAFLLIMSCFWAMMYQVWDLHPNFIEDWVDSGSVAKYVPFDSWWEYGDRGLVRVPQQILITLNAFLIVLLVVPISWMVRKMRTLSAMLIGMTVATFGTMVAGLTGNGWILLTGIVFFSLGEMLTGPKKNQYLGLIAPPGKKGLYLGYVNIPVGIGVGFGSMLAGLVYDNYGEKATLALKHLGTQSSLVGRAVQVADWSDVLHKIPELVDNLDRDDAVVMTASHLDCPPEDADEILFERFRFDQGQVGNLALQYFATHGEQRDKTARGFAKLIEKRARDLEAKVESMARSAADAETNGTQTDGFTAGQLKARDDAVAEAQRLERMCAMVDRLLDTSFHAADIQIGAFIGDLPTAADSDPNRAFELVRETINKDRTADERLGDAQVVEFLWQTYRQDRETLTNLALEYLAQETTLVRDAVSELTFDDPVKELPIRLGIGRTKSFAALSAALGAGDNEVSQALAETVSSTESPDLAAYSFLIGRPHIRFVAASRKDWSNDLTFLRDLIRDDEAAIAVVLEGIDDESFGESIVRVVGNIFSGDEEQANMTPEGIDYRRLADKTDLVRKALDAKSWEGKPLQAARLLGLNPSEARAKVAAELNDSPLKTTALLWSQYDPQYKVWLPFAGIGILATIALYIFGQMAKRWADMNA